MGHPYLTLPNMEISLSLAHSQVRLGQEERSKLHGARLDALFCAIFCTKHWSWFPAQFSFKSAMNGLRMQKRWNATVAVAIPEDPSY
ncbi:hypothetical protein CK203_038822 [Vitis vinifera]|uniref:Uncharacterized protein n=1 Tax=Vitis vinifera TaxID=29760 RepID=A0A438I1T6_VITVI|nr:hypothetical protein CK203_038822 [Vitis vinifera]